jgi:serine/threonine-protein kinase
MTATGDTNTGRVLGGRYQLGARVGTGATSTVFEAVDLQLERPVAIKMLPPEIAEEPDLLRRFRTLAQQLASLSHPNIVAVYDWGQETFRGVSVPYLVVEHLPSGSLRMLIDRGRTLSPSQALVIGLDACRGLDHAHRKGFVHGELKPSNLMFGADRRLRIADMGLAPLIAEATGRDIGHLDLSSARYVSPEQALGEEAGQKSDVYSLTLCLVESVTGQVPFAGDTTVATLQNRVDRLLPVSADLGALASVLERAGRPDPVERSSAAELGRALVQTAEKLPRPAALPLLTTGTSLFDAPAGHETTSELTRFADPSSAMPRAEVAAAADAAGVAGVADGSGQLTRPRDPSGQVRRTTGGGRDVTGGRARVVQVDEPEVYDEQRHREGRRPVLIYLLLAIGLIAACVLGYIAYKKLTVPDYQVPNLVGIDAGEAQNQVASNDWNVESRTERSDAQPKGKVFRTVPGAGENLKQGKTFVMYVSDGPTMAALPQFTGKTLGQATADAQQLGLTLQDPKLQYDEKVPKDVIISWSVPAQPSLQPGAQVVKGTPVALVVSQGPTPRKVANVVGQPVARATATLKAQGLVGKATAQAFSDTVPAGAVVKQDPAAGATVARGSNVALTVSKGPDLVTMPGLAGLTFAQIQQTLPKAGLQLGTVLGDTNRTLVSATANGKPVTAGQKLKRNTRVDLVYF